jgi:hypothetical protein
MFEDAEWVEIAELLFLDENTISFEKTICFMRGKEKFVVIF